MEFRSQLLPWGLAVALALAGPRPNANANVYATHIQFSGGSANPGLVAGGSVEISYILNEPASLVTISILSGTTVIATTNAVGGRPGTWRGTNTIVWDGKSAEGTPVTTDSYSVSIIAASAGYTNWTQLTVDTNAGNYAYEPRGIAVDRNPASPYYGRVYVANAGEGYNPVGNLGDNTGVLKWNTDGSPADEGALSNDGYAWAGDGFSPWKIAVSADDFVYVSDFSSGGLITRWDPTLSSTSMLSVLRPDNLAGTNQLSGPFVLHSGTNTQLWMADTAGSNSQGILRFSLTSKGVCANKDHGTPVVGLDSSSPTNALSVGAYSVALDSNGVIYAVQNVSDPGAPLPRVFRFPAYDPSTNQLQPELAPDWAVGAGDDTYGQASGVAVDPTGTFLAIASVGTVDYFGDVTQGNLRILYATNGAQVANIDLGVSFNGGDTNHQDWDCAWDAVGNVYYVDASYDVWRAFSPPGTNQATTVASLTLVPGVPVNEKITIASVRVAQGTVTISFIALTTDSPGVFHVQSASAAGGPYADAAASVVSVSPGVFQAALPANGPNGFYRIRR